MVHIVLYTISAVMLSFLIGNLDDVIELSVVMW